EAKEVTLAHLDVLAVDAVDPGAADDDVDLLLARAGLVVLPPEDGRAELEPVDPEGLDAELASHEADGAARPRAFELVHVDLAVAHYMRKMPKVDSGTGAFNAAEIPSASTRRVSR